MLECQAYNSGKPVLTLEQFRVGWELWNLDWVFQYLSTDGASYVGPADGASYQDWSDLVRVDVLGIRCAVLRIFL